MGRPPGWRRLAGMRIRDVVRVGLLVAAAAAILVLERRRQARPYVERRRLHRSRNLVMAGFAAATVHLLEAPLVVPLARVVARRNWGLTHIIGGPRWLRQLIAIALLDYTLYLWHIVVHRVAWLWRFHLVHHVDLDLDATTGLRFHAGGAGELDSLAGGAGDRHWCYAPGARRLADAHAPVGAVPSFEYGAVGSGRASALVDRGDTPHARDPPLRRSMPTALELFQWSGLVGPPARNRAVRCRRR